LNFSLPLLNDVVVVVVVVCVAKRGVFAEWAANKTAHSEQMKAK